MSATPEPAEPVPGRALLALLIGLILLALGNGLVQVGVAERAQLEAQAGSRRPTALDALEHRLGQLDASAETERQALHKQIEDETNRHEQLRQSAQRALESASLDAAQSRYRGAWLGLIGRLLVLVGAYLLTCAAARHHQIAGLAMLTLFVYALTSDIRLSVG